MLLTIVAMAQAPAFPGAEGNGRYVTGGRGGEIRHVTNLNDRGAGSFRQAVNGNKAKIVVFDVAGVIPLASELTIGKNTTIEGQTAPSPGITLRYYTVRPSANNIIRFIRFRRGEEKDTNDGADCTWQRRVTGLILDHCSMSWSTDELASFYDNNNFTMQWCMMGEGLNSGHSKGAHSYGGIWGGKLASFHHNFLGFVQNRVPRFCGARYNWTGYTSNSEYGTYNWKNAVQAENVDFRNCVMYNWGSGGCYGGPGGGYINIVNNYYKGGPGTSHKNRVTEVTVAASGNSSGNSWCFGMTSRYFIKGNYVYGNSYGADYDWKGVVYDDGTYVIDGDHYSIDSTHYYSAGNDTINYKQRNGIDVVKIKLDGPGAPTGDVTTHSAENAYDKVLAYAGASLYRDAIDDGYVEQTRNNEAWFSGSVQTTTKGIIDVSTDDTLCYSENTPGWGLTRKTLTDSDADGMPDEWETANGLNPNDASDASAYTIDDPAKGGKGWYTNIEVYCNSLVEDIMKAENADAISAVDEYYPVLASTSAIRTITANNNGNADAPLYNVAGQRVDKSYKGIVIQNGHKFIRK